MPFVGIYDATVDSIFPEVIFDGLHLYFREPEAFFSAEKSSSLGHNHPKKKNWQRASAGQFSKVCPKFRNGHRFSHRLF